MIIESIVSTVDINGADHLAPMGAIVDGNSWEHFELRPFEGSRTLDNLLQNRSGVLNLTDDSLLFARLIAGRLEQMPKMLDSIDVPARRLANCGTAMEFRVVWSDESGGRYTMRCRSTREHFGKHFTGFNRARYAVVEGAILISRIGIIPDVEIERQLMGLQVIVNKTAGADEREAWQILMDRFAGGARS